MPTLTISTPELNSSYLMLAVRSPYNFFFPTPTRPTTNSLRMGHCDKHKESGHKHAADAAHAPIPGFDPRDAALRDKYTRKATEAEQQALARQNPARAAGPPHRDGVREAREGEAVTGGAEKGRLLHAPTASFCARSRQHEAADGLS